MPDENAIQATLLQQTETWINGTAPLPATVSGERPVDVATALLHKYNF